ncbi:hypothetical protein CERSUDRAFT_98810 [Gelatoporia subvermispora B]|uniref:Uncharacterized protein n=1 Tax=Ceriporiopsis subvermispora (strain B) TaxID=914234 RepID=M2R4S9_CERS8|nr:hypothetical protein CERSUDRAFT_98810 [Gelatoporia subvermispora B]
MPKDQSRAATQDSEEKAEDWRRGRRRRASREAYEFIKQEYRQNTELDINDVLNKVKRIYGPDAAYMTRKSVWNMLDKMRKREHCLSPSERRARIQELLQNNPDPSFKTVRSWTTSLGATQATVFREVAKLQDEMDTQDTPVAGADHGSGLRLYDSISRDVTYPLPEPPLVGTHIDKLLRAADDRQQRDLTLGVSGQDGIDIATDALGAEGGGVGAHLLGHQHDTHPIVHSQQPSSPRNVWGAANNEYLPLSGENMSAYACWPSPEAKYQ